MKLVTNEHEHSGNAYIIRVLFVFIRGEKSFFDFSLDKRIDECQYI